MNTNDDYMKGWHLGAMLAEVGDNLRGNFVSEGEWTEDMQRGFESGRGAAQVAERVEQERQENCPDPNCELKRGHKGAHEFKLYIRGPR